MFLFDKKAELLALCTKQLSVSAMYIMHFTVLGIPRLLSLNFGPNTQTHLVTQWVHIFFIQCHMHQSSSPSDNLAHLTNFPIPYTQLLKLDEKREKHSAPSLHQDINKHWQCLSL